MGRLVGAGSRAASVMSMGPSASSAADEIERRVAAAAQAVRERDLCSQQHRQLSAREQTAAAELAAAAKESAGAERDVERLEHLSLTRVLAALHGAREDALAREKAEAARYRYAEARQRLDAVRAELASRGGWRSWPRLDGRTGTLWPSRSGT